MRKINALGWTWLLSATVVGSPIHAAAPAVCHVAKLADLPITVEDRRPLTTATIGGANATFVVDTGTLFSRISPGSAARYGLKSVSTDYQVSNHDIHRTGDLVVANVSTMTLAGLRVPDIDFLIVNSDPVANGAIGQNILMMTDEDYDLAHGRIGLMRSEGCEHADLAYWPHNGLSAVLDFVPASMAQQRPTFDVFVNGQRLRATFNTSNTRTAIARAASARVGAAIARDASLEGLAPKSDVVLADVRIGDEEIRHTSLPIVDDLADVDMVIGFDFFLSHRIYVANALHRAFFTYVGGPAFDAMPGSRTGAAPTPDLTGAEPADAAGYDRRAALYVARGDTVHAEADYARAIALAPNEPDHFVARARMRLAAHQIAPATDDVEHALAIASHLVPALVLLGQIRSAEHDHAAALAAADLAAATAPAAADERLDIAGVYSREGKFDTALAQLDLWIRDHPLDSRMGNALNGRCWTRALAGTSLDKALRDCNAALRIDPKQHNALDSRGLVELRMGAFTKAKADYDSALAVANVPSSLYGRGLAERHLGLAEQGNRDIAAAIALAPQTPDLFKSNGIN